MDSRSGGCAVIDRGEDKGAEERAVDGNPTATKKACAADDGGSDRLQFPSFRRRSVSNPDSSGEQNCRQRRRMNAESM